MAGQLILEGAALILAATSAPATRTDAAAMSSATLPVRTRDERIGAVALRGFPGGHAQSPAGPLWTGLATDPAAADDARVRAVAIAQVSPFRQF